MSWNVDQIYGFMRFLIRKNQAGGISANDFFYAWNAEQTAYHEDLLGHWQAHSNGKSGMNTGLILNETIMTKLAPFTIPVTIPIVAALVTKPEDLIYTLAVRINNAKVTQVDASQKWSVLDDVIDPASVSTNTYYYTEYEDYYSLLPDTLPSGSATDVVLDYIAAVTDVVWGYTLDGDGRQVYDSATSVQPKWNQNTIIEITKRSLKTLGVSFKDQDFAQFGNSNIITGD